MSLKSEFANGLIAITAAAALGALAVKGTSWMRGADAPASSLPGPVSSGSAIPPPQTPSRDARFEAALDTQLSWGTPILQVFALCHGRTSLETGDGEFRHSRVDGLDWLEYYESAILPEGGIAIRGFRAPMAGLTATSLDGTLLVTSGDAGFIGGAWHVSADGQIDDALQLEPAPGLAIPACLDAEAAAAQLMLVFAGDHSQVRTRTPD